MIISRSHGAFDDTHSSRELHNPRILLSEASLRCSGFISKPLSPRFKVAGHWSPSRSALVASLSQEELAGTHADETHSYIAFTPTGKTCECVFGLWGGHANCRQEDPSWTSYSNRRATVKQATKPSRRRDSHLNIEYLWYRAHSAVYCHFNTLHGNKDTKALAKSQVRDHGPFLLLGYGSFLCCDNLAFMRQTLSLSLWFTIFISLPFSLRTHSIIRHPHTAGLKILTVCVCVC